MYLLKVIKHVIYVWVTCMQLLPLCAHASNTTVGRRSRRNSNSVKEMQMGMVGGTPGQQAIREVLAISENNDRAHRREREREGRRRRERERRGKREGRRREEREGRDREGGGERERGKREGKRRREREREERGKEEGREREGGGEKERGKRGVCLRGAVVGICF